MGSLRIFLSSTSQAARIELGLAFAIVARTNGTTRLIFAWDAQNDQYVCPEGQSLKQFRRNDSDPGRGPTGKGVAKYRALKLICQTCPFKAQCFPNMDFRSITHDEHEDARQVARDIAKTKPYLISMLDLSRLDAAPLIAFTATKETDYGTETDGRIPARCGAYRADKRVNA